MHRILSNRNRLAFPGLRERLTALRVAIFMLLASVFTGPLHANLVESPPIDLKKAVDLAHPESITLTPTEEGIRAVVTGEGWQTFALVDRAGEAPLDLNGCSEIEVSVNNFSQLTTQMTLILESDGEKPQQACFMLRAFPGENSPIRLPIFHLPYSYSGWDWPLPWSKNLVCSWGQIDLGRIAKIKIRINETADFELGKFHRAGAAPSAQWVDEFGQRMGVDWAQKVATEAGLKSADEAESELQVKGWPDRDSYGAWKRAPKRKATGFFRVEEVNGRWWMIAPNGRLFFSSGINCVVPGIETSAANERVRDAYTWLPEQTGPFASAWEIRNGTLTVSMHIANMIRKWGEEDWREKAGSRAANRLRRWGFNTLGNWSSDNLRKDRPWVSVGPNDYAPPVSPMKVRYIGNKLQDPYDPAFLDEARRVAESSVAPYKDDPWLLGHFIGNEVGWNQFFENILICPDDQPAKVALMADLREKYGDIDALNTAWGADSDSMENLRWPGEFEQQFTEVAAEDLTEFRAKFADKWYASWSQVIREADPNHMILGSRFHGKERQEEVLMVAAKYCDVLSFNEYSLSPDPAKFGSYYQICKRPFLIGEFGHNSLDTGNLTCASPVASQEERGVGYRLYMETLAAQPWFVGAHFFQYYDEPITGRPDSETAYNGMVAVTDIPWRPLAVAAIETHRRIYDIHAGGLAPTAVLPAR